MKLPQQPKGDNGYSAWLVGLTHGKGYAGDGRSHIFDFDLEHSNGVTISAQVAALLPAAPDEEGCRIALSSPYTKPYWHLERARLGTGRRVLVELVVNGQVDQSQQIEADGALHSVSFTHRPQISSWYALRIYPSAHTQPVFVELGGKPVRASRRSAEWCRQAIDALWSEKKLRIRPGEMKAASTAYNHARLAYENIMQEVAEE